MPQKRFHVESQASPTSAIGRAGVFACVLGAVAGLASPASAQLREQQTLVVYDSRIADSKAIAEFYAGSQKVPGGAGNIVGVHPNVLTVDISSLTTAASTPAGVVGGGNSIVPDIDYWTFTNNIRDPLRVYLWTQQLTRRVRCIVLTRGIPHRVQQISTGATPLNPTIGDNPGLINQAFNNGQGGNLTYCSVDSELTLLFQSLDTGEAGVPADSRADGMILNPFWRATATINGYTTRNLTAGKLWSFPGGGNNGIYWLNGTDPSLSTTLTAGDMYLVCRLDGNSVGDVTAMITRAQNVSWPLLTGAFLLDSDGGSLDNQGPTLDNGGADYSLTKIALNTDGRFAGANTYYNIASNFTGFVVGPNVSYASATNGPPIVLSVPMLLVASYGANHAGVSPGNAGNGSSADTTWGTSFNYLPGAVFNSIESYNGRAFGGNGQNIFVPQQQAADVLAMQPMDRIGATFAVCNAWEPFGETIPDNQQLALNFFLGNMTWGEAAYSAMPVISWQQMAIGDPLARPRRDREDINGDGKVNIDDLYAYWAAPIDLNNQRGVNDFPTTPTQFGDYWLLERTTRGFEAASMKGDQR